MDRKKVLIISYYWPPAGGISPIRILKFTKYLRKFGWEPIVCVPQGADYLYEDPGYFKDVPENIRIIRSPIIEPFGLYKFLSGRKKNDTNNPVYGNTKKNNWVDEWAIWIRGNFFIPDARALWIRPTVKRLSRFLKENKVDAILTDGPPHTNTVIGMRLAKKFGIPWLADFQDPWTQVDYYQRFKLTRRADRKHKQLEQEVFCTAAKITIASPTWAKDLEAIGAKNVSVIYYGYDEDDFIDLKEEKHPYFIISHTGILGEDRNPQMLFKALHDLTDELPAFRKKLKIKLAGPVDAKITDEIKKQGLEKHTEILGNISRRAALQLNKNAQILLLPINKAPNAKGRLPGKLYEYLRIGKPVLALGPQDSDAAEIIRQTKSGQIFPYDDYESVKQFVRAVFEGKLIFRPENIEQFTNENQTKILAGYLYEIIR